MPRRTNEFQELIAVIETHLDPGATVEESAMLRDRATGTTREVDICITGKVAGHTVIVSVECRSRGRPADVTWIDEMHAKHSRLETNVLVLVSHSSFSAEAVRVADLYGIRHVDLDDVDNAELGRLFPETSSLWGKTWSVTIDRVLITVEFPGTSDSGIVRAHPDTSLFLTDGTCVCSAGEMAHDLLTHEQLQRQIGSEATPDHKFAEFGWCGLELAGKRLCLQKLDPLQYQPIQRFAVIAKCDVSVNEFPLQHGRYGTVRVAWGAGNMLGTDMMVVATAQQDGATRLTLRPRGNGV